MKGQSAMEYLMTYGWAIVVIVIVVGILAVLLSGSQSTQYCTISPIGTFTCEGSPVVTAPDGNAGNLQMTITVRNNHQEAVEFPNLADYGFACVNAKVQDVDSSMLTRRVITIAPGGTYTFKAQPTGNDGMLCKTINNANAQGTSGSRFSGTFVMKYKLASDPSGVKRTALATVEGSVAQR